MGLSSLVLGALNREPVNKVSFVYLGLRNVKWQKQPADVDVQWCQGKIKTENIVAIGS